MDVPETPPNDMLAESVDTTGESSDARMPQTGKRLSRGCRFIPLRKRSDYDSCSEAGMEAGSGSQVSNSEERTRKEFSQVPRCIVHCHEARRDQRKQLRPRWSRQQSSLTRAAVLPQVLAQELFQSPLPKKVLEFGRSALQPEAPVGVFQSNLRASYLANCTSATAGRRTRRYISQSPERILDAPELVNDFYLNLLDWSCDNILAGESRALRGFYCVVL